MILINQNTFFHLVLETHKKLLAVSSFNASSLEAFTWCLLIVIVKAERLTRMGCYQPPCQVFFPAVNGPEPIEIITLELVTDTLNLCIETLMVGARGECGISILLFTIITFGTIKIKYS